MHAVNHVGPIRRQLAAAAAGAILKCINDRVRMLLDYGMNKFFNGELVILHGV